MIADYYDMLGLPRTASLGHIRRKVYTLGTQYFPGRPELLDEPQKFISILEAYEVLYDEKTRTVYDFLLDHREGKEVLRPHALEKHLRVLDGIIRRGRERGKYYAGKTLNEFKEDFRLVNWWNVALNVLGSGFSLG